MKFSSLKNIGIVYKAKSELEKAISYFEEAKPILKQISSRDEKFMGDLGNTLILLGETYMMMGDSDRAVRYLEEAVQLERKTERTLSTFALVSTEVLLAQIYLDKDDVRRAKAHILSGESLLGQ